MRAYYCSGIYVKKSLSLELGISLRFPCLRPLCKINTNENLRSFPQLNEVDDVLRKEHPKGRESNDLRPGQMSQHRVREPNGCFHPLHEI